jgi:imidazole glycerol-phosphate synthase subunit HisF
VLRPRIIPYLLVSEGALVKTVQFRTPRYVGDPINAVKIFNEKEADELAVVDIDATAMGRVPDFTLVERLAVECRMPLCYGGGVKSVDQARRIVGLGVEKVALSSAAVETPELIGAIADEIGSQSVVVVVDVRRRAGSVDYEVWTHNARRRIGRSLSDVLSDVQRQRAGEIVINSIDDDGRMKGYDLNLAGVVRRATHLPMTMLGGAGSLADIGRLVNACGILGAAAGSLFVFKGAYRAVLINYPNHAQKEELIGSALRHERTV